MSLPQSSKKEGSNLKTIREQFNAVYPMAHSYVEHFAPDYAHKKDLKKDITHVLLTSPEDIDRTKLHAIRHILRIRGRASYVRPIAEKKNYKAKYFDLTDAELLDLPEMERMAVIMRDRYQFDAIDICNLLHINQAQLQWLYFNTDSVLGPNRRGVFEMQTEKFPNSELNKAWVVYAAAFHAQPLQRQPGVLGKFALTYVSITLVALLCILGIGQLYLNLRTQSKAFTPIATNENKELKVQHPQGDRKTGSEAGVLHSENSKSNTAQIGSKKRVRNSLKNQPKGYTIADNHQQIAIVDTISTVSIPTVPEEGSISAAFPSAIGIHSQNKTTTSSILGGESRRIAGSLPMQKRKFVVFARIGLNGMRIHNTNVLATGNIAIGMKVQIQSRIALRISAGIAHASHKPVTVVQKQYQAPSTNSPVVIDSCIFNGLRVGQLHVSQEMQVTKNIIVHAGGIFVYRLANMGKVYTSNTLNVESTPIQSEGVIAQHQTFDFAHFNRDPLYSRLMGGICAGISWRPPLLSHKMLLRAVFNYLPLYRRVNGPVPISRSAEMQLIIEI